jgi:cold shock CspA family protein
MSMTTAVEKEKGIITAWFPDKGFGFIRSTRPGFTTEFFLHISRIVSGEPMVFAPVLFHILTIQEGKRASAVNVEVGKRDEHLSSVPIGQGSRGKWTDKTAEAKPVVLKAGEMKS